MSIDDEALARLRSLLAKAVETPWVVASSAPLTIVAEFEAHLPLGGSIEPGHDARHYAWPIARMADPNGLPRWSAEQTAANAELIAAAISALPALLDIAEAVARAPVVEVTREDWLENFTQFGADLIGKRVRIVTTGDGAL